jgi:hypothetical protein
MPLRRRTRFLAALLAMAGLVFAQLAISGYSCPMDGGDPGSMASANLCAQHCEYGSSIDPGQLVVTLPAVIDGPAMRVTGAPKAPAACAPSWDEPAAGPAPPPPRATVLRI